MRLLLVRFIRSVGTRQAAAALLLIDKLVAFISLPCLTGIVQLLSGATGSDEKQYRCKTSDWNTAWGHFVHLVHPVVTTLIIQLKPKRSVSMPKRDDQKVLVSGICT